MTDHRKTYAFPSSNMVFDEIKEEFINHNTPGMDLRDYFAAKAMQTFLRMNGTIDSPTTISEDAYRLAEAMMKVRKA